MMHVIDHLFAFVLVVVYPVAGYVSYRRLLRRVAAGQPVERAQLYRATAIGHWTLLTILLVIWWAMDRPWAALGVSFAADTGFLLGVGATLVAIALLVLQLRQVMAANQAARDRYRAQFGDAALILPRDRGELKRFYGLSVTAGIVEETLSRGFLIWYLDLFMSLPLAAALSAIAFGLAHAYQGIRNVPKITLVGAAFAGLYLLSGSLWLPMILHAAVDMLQGRLAYEIVRDRPVPGDAVPPESVRG